MNPGSEADLRHAISLRPSVFSHPSQQEGHHSHRDLHRSESGVGIGSSSSNNNEATIITGSIIGDASSSKDDITKDKEGHSTAFEVGYPATSDGIDHQPVARHVEKHVSIDPGLDVESQRKLAYTRENDPLQLSTKIKSEEEINLIRASSNRKSNGSKTSLNESVNSGQNRTSRPVVDGSGGGNGDAARRASISTSSSKANGGYNRIRKASRALCAPPFLSKGNHAIRTRRLQDFYTAQNQNINRLLKPVDDHRQEAKDQHGETELRYKIAVRGSFAANVCLAILQLYAAIASGSLSLFTTMIDSLFDPMSNVALILCNRAVNRVDSRRFPSGKARIETAGNIGFCFLMTTVSVVIIVQSIRDLVAGSPTRTNEFHLPSIIAVSIAFVTKLGLFSYCFAIRNIYSQVRILWEDHRNDLIINFFGLFFSLLGSKVRWWIDPMGAIVLSCLIVFLWLRTAYSEFQLLIGVSADTNTLQLITYISMTHSPDIKAIDTVRAYYSGPRLIVEVDVVMDPEDTLRHTHDVAEDLQQKLESLPAVERAYVHVDFETSHAPEHFLKKEL